MSSRDSEWDDDEIVPLGALRPSRDAFGPLPAEDRRPRPPARNGQGGGQVRGARPNGRPPVPQQRQGGRNGAPQPHPGVRQQPFPGAPQSARPAQGNAGGNPQANRAAGRGGPAQVPARRDERTVRQPQRPPSHNESSWWDEAPPSEPQRGGRQAPRARQRQTKQPQPKRPQRRDAFANDLAEEDRYSTGSRASTEQVTGWRGAVAKATGGIVNLGPSEQDRTEADLRQQLRRPVTDGTVAVFSRKGGVGKTTIAAYLGLTLANERGGRIVALDGDAEAGSLGWLLAPQSPSTLAALASASPIPADYGQLRRYTAATPEGLEVIVGEPAEVGPISVTGLEAVADQLSRHYDLSIFDTGAGVTRATGRVLVTRSRTLLLVMSPSIDSVRAAERTLAWLEGHWGEAAHPEAQVIAVINGIPSNAKGSHIERIESHFAETCSGVVRIPWDSHLAAGSSSVSLDRLSKPTRDAFVELAATTVSCLAKPRRKPQRSRRAS